MPTHLRAAAQRSMLVCALVVGAAACSPGGDAPAAGTSPAAGPTSTTNVASNTLEYDRGNIAGFYRRPDPLPPGSPGEIIRMQQIRHDHDQVTVRVMYHSTDATGADRAVTGVITYPTSAPPEGGWPVLSTAHGTTGIASRCAPSRTATTAPGWGVRGVWAMTDYIGLGPIGERHAYLSKADEGDAVIDIVRAARRLPAAHASTRWIAIGHSQGGHGALAAAELARTRAPELHLAAAIALAPAAELDRVYGGIDPIVTAILTMMGTYGAQAEHPEIDLHDIFTPDALRAAKVFDTGCLGEITDALIPVAAAGPFVTDPRTTEPMRSILLADDVGRRAVEVPMLLASGTADDRVVLARFIDTATRICQTGQHAEIHVIDGATHDSILTAMAPRITAFITDVLQGRATPDSCSAGRTVWSTPTAP